MESQHSSTIVNLSTNQARAIPLILSAQTLEAGCKAAGISTQSFYNWMENPDFSRELTRQRNQVIQEGLQNLKASLGKAVQVLVDCLNSKNESVRRRAANDLLTHCLRLREIEEVEGRLEALEEVIIRKRIYK